MSKKKEAVTEQDNRIVVFQEKSIRRTWHQNEWWFVVEDVVLVLVDSKDPKQYIQRMKQRDPELGKGWVQIVHTLPIETSGGTQRMVCANTEGIFRIIQSIPSLKAEPFKRWLAQVGYERVKEIEDPELASLRARELYEAKGYSPAWIEKRLRAIAVRGELTNEWKERGVREGREYSILTAEIARATFGVTPVEHGNIKGLDQVKTGNNLRDHMTDLELIFTMLGEAGTTEIARKKNAQGLHENKHAAREGGSIAGNARRELEAKTGTPVVSSENYLNPSQTRFTRTATAAFIETQAEALSPDSTDLSKTRKRVQKKVRQAIKELGGTMPENLPKHGKTIKQFEREKKRIEGKKE
ncbi:MAG: phage antirepressor protein [Nitrospirae bacterium]|nr:phage antirepressor protein [Nitrospirota bacterium]